MLVPSFAFVGRRLTGGASVGRRGSGLTLVKVAPERLSPRVTSLGASLSESALAWCRQLQLLFGLRAGRLISSEVRYLAASCAEIFVALLLGEAGRLVRDEVPLDLR
jgi:hypothetical protein